MYFKFILAITFLLFNIHQIECKSNGKYFLDKKPECNPERMKEADLAAHKVIMFGKNGRLFPENQKQLKTFCNESSLYIDRLDKFSNDCLIDEIQKLTKVAIFSSKRLLKTFCGNKKSKKTSKLLKYAPCVNTKTLKLKCLDDYLSKAREIIPYKTNDKLKHACCNNIDMKQCFEKNFYALPCMDDDGVATYMDLISASQTDTINFACGDYTEETDRCEHLVKPDKKLIDPSIKTNKKLTSVLFTFIFLLQSMDDFSFGN